MAIFQKIALNICKREKTMKMTSILSTTDLLWYFTIILYQTAVNVTREWFLCLFIFFSPSRWSTIQSKIIEASRLICHTFPVGPLVLVMFVHSCLFHSFRISPLNTLEKCRLCVEEWSQNSVVEARQCLAAQVNAKYSVRIKV